jgi:LCP family protein required for cell wall assembly
LTISFCAPVWIARAETTAATVALEEPVDNAKATTVTQEAAEGTVATDIPTTEAQQGDWWNILLLGGDSRSKNSYERTDSMIILSINEIEGKAKMTSIMRDTWVDYPGINESGKINAANVYGGPELAMATVNECFGTDIQDYVLINMAGLVDVIDQLGGIDIPVTASEQKWVNVYANGYSVYFGNYDGETSLSKAGKSVHLNGLLAMSYCRIRIIGTDYARTQRQRTVLMAILEKMKSQNVAQIAASIITAAENVETDLNISDMLRLANFVLMIDIKSVDQYRIPADGTFESGMKDGFWSIRPNFSKNKDLLHDFIFGAI